MSMLLMKGHGKSAGDSGEVLQAVGVLLGGESGHDRSKMATPVESENGCGEKELHKIKERARRAREKQLLARLQSLLFDGRESPPSASEVIARLLLPRQRLKSIPEPWRLRPEICGLDGRGFGLSGSVCHRVGRARTQS